MQHSKPSAAIANEIMAAGPTVADQPDPDAVQRLAMGLDGQLYVLDAAGDMGRVDGGIAPEGSERVARGYTNIVELKVWLPVDGEPGRVVARVLVQLEEFLREQVTGVEVDDGVGDVDAGQAEHTGEDDVSPRWASVKTRLYRTSLPVDFETLTPLASADLAFDETGVAQLVIRGSRQADSWWVSVQAVVSGQRSGKPIAEVLARSVLHRDASGDVIETVREWIISQLPQGVSERLFLFTNRAHGSVEDDVTFFGRMDLERLTLHNA